MASPLSIEPIVGDWYRCWGDLFEVVAFDDDDRTIEIQYHDGSVEEMEMDDWNTRCKSGALQLSEPPEDSSGAMDSEPDEEQRISNGFDTEVALQATTLEGLDLFE